MPRKKPAAPTATKHAPKSASSALKWFGLIVILGLGAYYLYPQLGQLDDIWQSLQDVNLWWLAAALVASMSTYYMSALTVIGSTKRILPWSRTVIVQIASTVLNRITPKGFGTAAVTERYLEKQGSGRAEAIAGVSIIYAVGSLMHGILLVGALLFVRPTLFDFSQLNYQQFAVIAAVLGIVVLVVTLIPALHRPLSHWASEVRQGLRYSATRPIKLALLVGGSAGITLCFSLALYCAMAGVGHTIPFGTILLIYLASGLAGLASPAPGGLGATEAALAVGLSAAGVPISQAITGVLVFRLASFWFPILPGLVALRYARKRRYL